MCLIYGYRRDLKVWDWSNSSRFLLCCGFEEPLFHHWCGSSSLDSGLLSFCLSNFRRWICLPRWWLASSWTGSSRTSRVRCVSNISQFPTVFFFFFPSSPSIILNCCTLSFERLSVECIPRPLTAWSGARWCLMRKGPHLVVVLAASLDAWLAIKQWEDRPPLNCSVDQCYLNSSTLFIPALISFLAPPLPPFLHSFPRLCSIHTEVVTPTVMFHGLVEALPRNCEIIVCVFLTNATKFVVFFFFFGGSSQYHRSLFLFNSLVVTLCACVCTVVSTLKVYCMMSERRASNLIKKEIKVDVCYFQLRCSTAICQSQRCDCFGPTVIHCLSKY